MGIRIITKNEKLICEADTTGRFSVYLDNDAIIELSKRSPDRRQRFVDAIRRGGTLMFSQTNAAEIGGPKGDSSRAVRHFLESIGSDWVPIELNPIAVVKREQAGEFMRAPICETLMNDFVRQRYGELRREGAVDTSAETFFSLAKFVDWLQDRDEIVQEAAEMDRSLQKNVQKVRVAYEADPKSLDAFCPTVTFDPEHRTTFVFNHLFRLLVVESKGFALKRNDGVDFCHAVMAASYSNLATLDKHWKRRVESLPKPNELARIFYRPEVDALVETLEALVSRGNLPGEN